MNYVTETSSTYRSSKPISGTIRIRVEDDEPRARQLRKHLLGVSS